MGGAGMHGHARARVESQKLSVVFGPNATYSEIFNGRIRIQLNLVISQMRISGRADISQTGKLELDANQGEPTQTNPNQDEPT